MDISDEEITKSIVDLNTIYVHLQDKNNFLGMPGEVLSYTAAKVATMKARLVEVKAMAEMESKDADTQYKATKAKVLRSLIGTPVNPENPDGAKVSATAAGELIYGEDEVIEAANLKTRKEVQFNKLKSLCADGHDVIEVLRGRLIDMQGSRKDESIR